ncbi:MAG: hypothetical protein DMG58_35360 [Acidobacteria bacterium]|nr:MAG: hypothetical protein DMG58_35360 [Acidobacteriota bacterium]
MRCRSFLPQRKCPGLGGASRRVIRCSEGDYYQHGWREDLVSGAKHQLDGLQQSVGTKAEQLIVAGDVPHTVCAQAEELRADVLVIGRSSESGLLGRLRTNAYAIIRGAHCPVISV